MDISKYKDYLAPRYWLALLSGMLILMGLTGGTTVSGIDLTIKNPVMEYAALILGVISGVYAYRAHMKYVKRTPDPND